MNGSGEEECTERVEGGEERTKAATCSAVPQWVGKSLASISSLIEWPRDPL
jgi:hypothetical protein